MLKRIVKLTFQEDKTEAFQEIFREKQELIESHKGCRSVQLLRDIENPNVFFTISLWDNEDYLNAYRHSTLFQSTWAVVKTYFDDKPEAWSLRSVH